MIFYQRSYVQASRLPILNKWIRSIRRRLEAIHSHDELTIRRETIKILFRLISVTTLLVMIIVFFNPGLFTSLWLFIFIITINAMLMDKYVYRIEDQLLHQQTYLLTDVRHFYQETDSVDESISSAAQVSNNLVSKHAKRIHKIITEPNPDLELKKYYEVAPNRYLKLFAAISQMILEFGDKITEKYSLFLRSISRLNQDINAEVIRRNKTNSLLRGFTTLALVPVFFIYPLEWWAKTYLPMSAGFYESKIMIIFKVIVFAVSLAVYMILRKIQEPLDTKYVAKPKRIKWEKKLYELRPLSFLVHRLTPNPYTSKRYKLEMLIKEANAFLTLEWLYVRKIILCLSTFILIIFLSVYLHQYTIQQTLHALTIQNNGIYFAMSNQEKEEALALTKYDRNILLQVKGVKTNQTELIKSLVTQSMDGAPETAINMTTHRILNKLNVIENAYIKWWEVLLAITLSLLAYQSPNWILLIQRKLRFAEIEGEVDQLASVSSILSQFDQTSVEDILEWMERFSIMFKAPLRKCLLNYASGPRQALEELKTDVPFISFTRLVDRLISALEKSTVYEAFDDIEIDQEFHKHNQEMRFEDNLMKKKNLASLIALIPLGLVFILILIVPLLYVSIDELMNMVKQFEGTRNYRLY